MLFIGGESTPTRTYNFLKDLTGLCYLFCKECSSQLVISFNKKLTCKYVFNFKSKVLLKLGFLLNRFSAMKRQL